MAHSVGNNHHWTVGSPKIVRGCKRMAFALSLFGVAGAVGVAVDLLGVPRLFGGTLDARAALLYLAWTCTFGGVYLGALLVGLQRADVHTGDEVANAVQIQRRETT